MRRRSNLIALIAICTLLAVVMLTGCNTYGIDKGDEWKMKYDLSNPQLNTDNTSIGKENAREDGWYMTMNEEFNEGTMPKYWNPAENCRRNEAYWCDEMIEFRDGNAVIKAVVDDNHKNTCKHKGCGTEHNRITSGIITCRTEDNKRTDDMLFSQAFGYYEVRCKVPNSDGIWSAFWLQTPTMGNIGNKGEDGAEIDIFESNFFRRPNHVGSCVHYDGYKGEHRSLGAVHEVPTNTYEGYHTYGLKWTPNEYVFYYDGEPTWATDYDGVCKVPAFLMLTSELRDEGISGPYGDRLGKFSGNAEFLVDYVRVYQNTNYEPYIRTPESFR